MTETKAKLIFWPRLTRSKNQQLKLVLHHTLGSVFVNKTFYESGTGNILYLKQPGTLPDAAAAAKKFSTSH
ncbi:MAG: hypothetical protein WKF84_16415 [Pyrinomonadaceae bacterium]